jgi:hypothetical protein
VGKKKKNNKKEGFESYFRHRKPIPHPGITFKDKSKYIRKKKHKKDWE